MTGVQGKLVGDQLITLRDIEKSLLQSIEEAESAIDSEAFWGKMAVGASFLKIGCDLAISAMSMLPPARIGATAVSMIYDRASLVTDILNAPEKGGGAIAQAIGEAHVDGLSKSLEYMGKDKAGKLIDAAKALIKAQVATDAALADMKANRTSGDGIAGARRSLLVQLRRTRQRMRELEERLADCDLR